MLVTTKYTVTGGMQIVVSSFLTQTKELISVKEAKRTSVAATVLTPKSNIGSFFHLIYNPNYEETLTFVCKFQYPETLLPGFLCKYTRKNLFENEKTKPQEEILFIDAENTNRLLAAWEKEKEKKQKQAKIEKMVEVALLADAEKSIPDWSTELTFTREK